MNFKLVLNYVLQSMENVYMLNSLSIHLFRAEFFSLKMKNKHLVSGYNHISSKLMHFSQRQSH